ncbi:MAG: YeiH family protein, partial [Gaiellaceae bacterium]
VLQAAIVALGATLSLSQVAHVGGASLPVMLGTLAVSLVTASVLGRLLGVGDRLRTLVGVGTGICGASAIAAVSGVVAATEAEIAYAISTIFVFNIVAVVTFPALGHALGLSQHAYGLWAGTAVNDTSSVVAAAFAFGHGAGSYAVLVKLTRTTMIIPIAATLAVVRARRGAHTNTRWTAIVPWFLLWFAVASAIDTAGLVGPSARHALSHAALVLITVALAAVGLSTRLGEARRTGHRPLVLGGLVWLSVAGSSLLLQWATGVT